MVGQGAGLAAAREAIAAREKGETEPKQPEPAAAAAPPAPPKSDTAPAKAPVGPAVKAQGEADKEKVPDQPVAPESAAPKTGG